MLAWAVWYWMFLLTLKWNMCYVVKTCMTYILFIGANFDMFLFFLISIQPCVTHICASSKLTDDKWERNNHSWANFNMFLFFLISIRPCVTHICLSSELTDAKWERNNHSWEGLSHSFITFLTVTFTTDWTAITDKCAINFFFIRLTEKYLSVNCKQIFYYICCHTFSWDWPISTPSMYE